MSLRFWALVGLTLVLGCRHRQAEAAPLSCSTPTESEQSIEGAERLAGTFLARLVSTEGPKTGQSTQGVFSLQPYDDSLRAVTIAGIRDTSASNVLYGSADIDLDAVDAITPGELKSLDPMQPGVLVVERKGSITFRLGSQANRRDAVRFDGGYTALRIRELADSTFAGTWASGLGTERSAGYFCAERRKMKEAEEKRR